MQICLYHPHPNQSHRYTRQIIRINSKTTCREALTHYIPEPSTARLVETCLGFGNVILFSFSSNMIERKKELFILEREIPPGDCLFDVITRNQAIEEFKIVVRRLHGMYRLFLFKYKIRSTITLDRREREEMLEVNAFSFSSFFFPPVLNVEILVLSSFFLSSFLPLSLVYNNRRYRIEEQ